MSSDSTLTTEAPLTDESFSEALLNILEDAQSEREQLRETQRAVMNILADSSRAAEEAEDGFQATVNILGDVQAEREAAGDIQASMINILDDFSLERDALAATQSAVLNILDDFGLEKVKAESAIRSLAREMTEREQAERALEAAKASTDATNLALEQANRQLESFSYSVAHDLRGPLRAINGFSRILVEEHADGLDGEGLRVLDVVIRNVGRMASLIDGLLAFSRLGRADVETGVVDMSEVVGVALRDLRDSGAAVSTDITLEPLEPAMADPTLIAQVWANLLSNAVKFRRPDEVSTVRIFCERREEMVVYFVADNGAGFDMQYADKLFGVFQRLHSATEYDGTGIGLAITARIVERHGGHIWAEAAVGEGATFSFSLPAIEAAS